MPNTFNIPEFQYTDFTDESVSLKEVILLRGVEVFSSLQSITKPFYLTNLTRNQSEDLGRAGFIRVVMEATGFPVPGVSIMPGRDSGSR